MPVITWLKKYLIVINSRRRQKIWIFNFYEKNSLVYKVVYARNRKKAYYKWKRRILNKYNIKEEEIINNIVYLIN